MVEKTRDRVIEAARRLFNRLHYGNVTIAALAAEAGISEGNLWYHFKDKRALLDAITERFLARNADRLALAPVSGDVLGSYAGMIEALGEEIRDFRFMYRDQADYGAHSDILTERLPEIYAATRRQFAVFFQAMKADGALDVDDEEIDDLVVNVVIVLRYGLEYLREAGEPDAEGTGAVSRSLRQHVSVFAHRLSPEAHADLARRFALERPDQVAKLTHAS